MEISAQELNELLDYERFFAKLQAVNALQTLGFPVEIDENGVFYLVNQEKYDASVLPSRQE